MLVKAIRAGVARLSSKDIRKLRAMRNKIIALNTRRDKRHRRSGRTGRIAIDSGATITLLKKSKWLRKLATRFTAIVRTAPGKELNPGARTHSNYDKGWIGKTPQAR